MQVIMSGCLCQTKIVIMFTVAKPICFNLRNKPVVDWTVRRRHIEDTDTLVGLGGLMVMRERSLPL